MSKSQEKVQRGKLSEEGVIVLYEENGLQIRDVTDEVAKLELKIQSYENLAESYQKDVERGHKELTEQIEYAAKLEGELERKTQHIHDMEDDTACLPENISVTEYVTFLRDKLLAHKENEGDECPLCACEQQLATAQDELDALDNDYKVTGRKLTTAWDELETFNNITLPNGKISNALEAYAATRTQLVTAQDEVARKPSVKISDGDVWLVFPDAMISVEGMCRFGAPGPITRKNIKAWRDKILEAGE